jgi:hypothetical protein
LDGWTIKFFEDFFDLFSEDLLRVIEEVMMEGRVPSNINSMFLALIPKVDHLETFNDFCPISLCNTVYKIISKKIVVQLKSILSWVISYEQFCFMVGRNIHEAVGAA